MAEVTTKKNWKQQHSMKFADKTNADSIFHIQYKHEAFNSGIVRLPSYTTAQIQFLIHRIDTPNTATKQL